MRWNSQNHTQRGGSHVLLRVVYVVRHRGRLGPRLIAKRHRHLMLKRRRLFAKRLWLFAKRRRLFVERRNGLGPVQPEERARGTARRRL
eukprot:1524026-Rhodomonas_salina.1